MVSRSSSRLLVVGGTGFIGRGVVKKALELSWETDCLSLHPSRASSRQTGVSYITCDLLEKNLLRDKLSGKQYNFIVNSGGYIDHSEMSSGGSKVLDTHFRGLENLIEVLDRTALRRFVQIGSSDEYGENGAPQAESQREYPISPYSFAKTAGTHFLQMLNKTEEFPSVSIRLFLTYGPGQDSNRFIPQVVNACLNNASFPVSSGQQIRDFCYIEDAVNGVVKALTVEGISGEIFNIASGQPVRIRDVVELIRTEVGGGYPRYGVVPFRKNENMNLHADVSKAREMLSWEPKTNLIDGVRQVINDLRKR